MSVRKQTLAACVAVASLAAARASAAPIVVDFEAASGYAPGAINGQPAAATVKWADTNNAFVVAAAVGSAGSQALQTSNTSTVSTSSASYKPAAASYGATFDPASSKLGYSFAVKELNAGQTAAHTLRVYFGGGTVGNSPAYLQFSTNATGTTLSVKPNAGNEALTTALGNGASPFHTVSGVIDYVTRTFTVNVDGTAANTGTGGTSSYGFVAAATGFTDFGSIFVQERSAASSTIGSYVIDDFALSAAVPEPATFALAAAGVALVGRRRRAR